MRKKLLIVISLYIIFIVSSVLVIKGYYNTNVTDYKQEYNISSLNFSVNGISAKNNTDSEGNIDESINTHTVDLTDIVLDHNDGFSVDLDLQARGTSNGSYAVSYTVSTELSSLDQSISPYIQVFQKIDGSYVYINDLYSFSQTSLTGLVGLNDDKYYNYLFVVTPNTNINLSNELLDIKFIATYDIEADNTVDSDYPYYYLSNSFETSGTSSTGSIFSKLASKEAELAGKTIVLTSDFDDFSLDEEIVLPFKVGLDLNGHTLNMNGASIRIAPYGDPNTLDSDVFIGDTNGGGSIINGNLYIDSPLDIIKIEDSILTETNITDNLVILNASKEEYTKAILKQLKKIQDKTLSSELENTYASVDVTNGLKYYLSITSGNYFTLNVYDGLELLSNLNGVVDIERDISTVLHNLTYTVSKANSVDTSVTSSVTVLGNGGEALADDLIKNIPNTVSHSIFLPSYDLSTRTEYKWITSNNELLNNKGQYLENGYKYLDSYQDQKINLTLIIEQDGKIYSRKINDINIQIFSLSERIDLINRSHQLTLSNTGLSTSNQGIFTISNTVKNNNLQSDTETYLTFMFDTYNIEPDLSLVDDSEKEIDVDQKFADKLGLKTIFIKEDSDQYSVTEDSGIYYLNDTNNIVSSAEYYINAQKFFPSGDLTGYETFELNVIELPVGYTVLMEYKPEYVFEKTLNGVDEVAVTNDEAVQIKLEPKANQVEAFNPKSDLLVPLRNYETTMSSSYDIVSKTNNVLSTENDTITYDVRKYYYLDDDNNKVYGYKDYIDLVSLEQGINPVYSIYKIDGAIVDGSETNSPITLTSSTMDSDGNFYYDEDFNVISKYRVNIIPGYVPDKDTSIILKATLDNAGVLSTYELEFNLTGIISNSSSGIVDNNLYYAILFDGDINRDSRLTTLEASFLKDIKFSGSGTSVVKSLNGLSAFDNLTNIQMDNNNIINIGELSNLTKLETVDLSNNNIVKLDGLSNLDSLTYLNLSNNSIIKLDPLRYLTNIVTLDVSNNFITTFEPISDYSNLTTLYVYDNPVSGLTTSTYYFTKIYNKNDLLTTKIYNNNSASYMTFATDAINVAKILDRIVLISETYGNLSFPQEYTMDGIPYSLQWSTNDISSQVLNFDVDAYPYYSYTSPSVDRSANIYVQATNTITDEPLALMLEFRIKLLKSADPRETIYLETTPGVFSPLAEEVPDSELRTLLYSSFNDESDTTTYSYDDGTNQYTYSNDKVISITERSADLPLSFANSYITDLTGIDYFSSSILDISQNDIVNLEPLLTMSSLKALTLGGTSYNFDELAGVSQTKTMTLTDLYLSGTYELDSYDTLEALYHVYKNNTTDTTNSDSYVNIYLTSDTTTPWDPFYEQLELKASEFHKSYNMYDLGDTVSINKEYSFKFYDDNEYTTFSISSMDKYSSNNENYVVGSAANKVSIVDNTVDNTFDITLSYLPGREVQFVYGISFTNGLQTDSSVTYNFSSDYTLTSLIHIEYNDTYYVDTSTLPEYAMSETQLSSIFPGNTIKDMAMTAISDIDDALIDYTSQPGLKILPVSYLSSLSTFSGEDNRLLTPSSDDDRVDLEQDGPDGVTGLRYFTRITELRDINDSTLGDGSDLVNIKEIRSYYSGFDLSSITTSLPKLINIYLIQPYFFELYDTAYYSNTDSSTYTDSNIYYLNYLPSLRNLFMYRANQQSPQMFDFRGLRGLIGTDASPNKIASITIYGLVGSSYPTTTALLDRIYSHSTNSPSFTIANTVGDAGVKVIYTPQSEIVDNAAAIGEYTDMVQDLVDYGPEVKIVGTTKYHYQDANQIYDAGSGDSITLPGFIKNLGGDIDGDGIIDILESEDDTVYEIQEDGTPKTIAEFNSYRRFNIDWYVYTRDIELVKLILGTTSVEEVEQDDINNQGLYKYKLTNLSNVYSLDDTVFTFNTPIYDTMFVLEGVVGNAINNINLSSSLTQKSTLYPITVLGSTPYNTDTLTTDSTPDPTSYKYKVGSDYFFSFRTFTEVEFRFAEWLAFNYKDMASASVSTYYPNIGLPNSTAGLLPKNRTDTVTKIEIFGSGETTLSNGGKFYLSQIKPPFSADNSTSGGATGYMEKAINNLEGIGIFKNATILNISGTYGNYVSLEDATFLRYMTNLETLSIYGSSFHDLSPIKYDVNLKSISLSYSEFESTYEVLGDGTYQSYFKNMTGLTKLDLNHSIGVTYLDMLALYKNIDPSANSGLSKYDNTTWFDVTKNGTVYKPSVKAGFFTGTQNSIITSGTELYLDNTESSYFVSSFLAMYVLFNSLPLDTSTLDASWTDTTATSSITKADYLLEFQSVLAAYYKATYEVVDYNSTTNGSFRLDGKVPTLMLDVGSFDDSGSGMLTTINAPFNYLPGSYAVPVKHEISFGSYNTNLYISYNYHLIETGYSNNIYIKFTDSTGTVKTINTSGDIIDNDGAVNRATAQEIFDNTLLGYFFIKSVTSSYYGGKVSQESAGSSTYVFDITDIGGIDFGSEEHYITSLKGTEYLPNLFKIVSRLNPIVEWPDYGSTTSQVKTTLELLQFSPTWTGIPFKYLDTTDLDKFDNLFNLTEFMFVHSPGDFTENLPNKTYSFKDLLTYKYTNLDLIYSAHNGMNTVYNTGTTTINEQATYLLNDRMYTVDGAFTLFGVENTKVIDGITYTANETKDFELDLAPYAEKISGNYSAAGSISKNLYIGLSYFLAVRWPSGSNFEPFNFKNFDAYNRNLSKGKGSYVQLVYNVLSIMNNDQKSYGVVTDPNRLLLYYKFEENSTYFMPMKEYFYGNWIDLEYAANSLIAEDMDTFYTGYGIRDFLTIPTLSDGVAINCRLYIYSAYSSSYTLKTQIVPAAVVESTEKNEVKNYYVEVNASEVDPLVTPHFDDYTTSLDGTRYFVKASEIYGDGNILFYLFTPDLVQYSYNESAPLAFYLGGHSIGYVNSNTSGTIDLIGGGELLDINLLDLSEQESITGFYNKQISTTGKEIYSLRGFERFVNMTEFYFYRQNKNNGMHINTIDLSPLSNLSLTQFYALGEFNYSTNNIYPLLEGSRESLIGFTYVNLSDDFPMFDYNILLAFPNLEFISLADNSYLSYTDTLSFRNFASYLYLYNKDLYDHLYLINFDNDDYFQLTNLYNTSTGDWDFSNYTTNVNVSGSDLSKVEILSNLEVGNLALNDYGFINLNSATSLSVPSTVLFSGIEYDIEFSSLSNFITITGDTLTVDETYSPGYGFIKVTLLVSGDKVSNPTERIIFVKF